MTDPEVQGAPLTFEEFCAEAADFLIDDDLDGDFPVLNIADVPPHEERSEA